jgi:glycosyltransferase involved in cell wall biosynthesis
MMPSDVALNPTISVCVPTYNNAATLARCLRSVLDQDGVDFEIVVVDDASSDDCVAIAATMLRPGDRLIRNESRLGLGGNHNKCIELARGTCIQFVHGDDWLLPRALQQLVPFFENPAVGLAFAPRRVVQDDIPRRWRLEGKPHRFFPKLRGRLARRHLPARRPGPLASLDAAIGGLLCPARTGGTHSFGRH